MQFKEEVVFTGHVQSKELAQLYGAAFALVYVSFFEGFGIPLVEAMKCEIPIISSNATCLPEVAGEAALYVNPHSVDEITKVMIQLNEDIHLQTELAVKAKERSV